MITPLVRPSPHLTEHENRAQWKLGRGQGKRFPRRRLVPSVPFVEDLDRPDFSDEVLRVSLAVAHPQLCGLLRDGVVRAEADEEGPATLDAERDGETGG